MRACGSRHATKCVSLGLQARLDFILWICFDGSDWVFLEHCRCLKYNYALILYRTTSTPCSRIRPHRRDYRYNETSKRNPLSPPHPPHHTHDFYRDIPPPPQRSVPFLTRPHAPNPRLLQPGHYLATQQILPRIHIRSALRWTVCEFGAAAAYAAVPPHAAGAQLHGYYGADRRTDMAYAWMFTGVVLERADYAVG